MMQKLAALVGQTLQWQGRASRKTLYVCIGLFNLVGLLSMPLVALRISAPSGPANWLLDGAAIILGAMMMAFLVGAIVRRLHDRNRSGGWLLVFFGPHVALAAAISRIADHNQQMIVFFGGGLLVAAPFIAWGMVEIFLLQGSRGANKYGPNPLASGDGPEPVLARL